MKIGFSTGDLLETDFPLQKALDNLRSIGANAIELKIGFKYEKFLREIDNLDFSGFEVISVHGPKFSRDRNIIPKDVIDAIGRINEKISLDWVVFHPDEILDWEIFRNCNFNVAIENNDWRKKIGKNVEDLEEIFSKNDIKFILDVNHCFTNDRTMQLAERMKMSFQNRLCGVHLSGFETETRDHEPMYPTKQKEMLRVVPINLPVIIESFRSAYRDLDEAKKELQYILENLNK